jgi:hypothetical protein
MFRFFGFALAESGVKDELYTTLVVNYLEEFYPYNLNPRLNGNVQRWRDHGLKNIAIFYNQRFDELDILNNGDKAACLVALANKKEAHEK